MEIKCTCERGYHTAPVEVIEVSENATEKIAEILKNYKRIYLVADENTYKVAGARAEELLREAGILSHTYILPGDSMATAERVGDVLIHAGIKEEPYNINHFSFNPDYVLAVGSGSVNDVCRMVSYRLGIPYGILGTAPSMDGYASVVAPLVVQNRKIVYDCSIARHIVIDLAVCAEAPMELLYAGIGDMIGKYVAILDWELSRMMTDEYFCENVANQVLEATANCIEAAHRLSERRPEDIRKIVEGLISSGMGIAYTGSSRPASGTEHMIGQTWEIMDFENHRPNHLHGIEVGQATFTAIAMYRKLYSETDDARIKALVEKYLPHFDAICALQEAIHIPYAVTDNDIFTEGVIRGRTFRVRYTVLQYLYDKGLLEEYTEYAYGETMKYQ